MNKFSENVKLQPSVTTVDTNDSFKVQKAGKILMELDKIHWKSGPSNWFEYFDYD